MSQAARRAWVGPADVRRALRALREAAMDPNRTDAIGEFIGSLTGPSAVRLYRNVWNDPVGRGLLEEGRDLKATLDDRDYLASLPAGSFGRSYFDWTASRGFSAQGLADAISSRVPREFDGPYGVMGARVVDMHDLWHVLNGWDDDIHGELHLLGYSYAQLGAYAWLILGLLAVSVLTSAGRHEGMGYLRGAIRRGRDAPLLAAVDWEAMLPLPIDEVRRRLGVEEPTPYEKLGYADLEKIGERSPVLRALRRVLPT